jgi:hypothetical protein
LEESGGKAKPAQAGTKVCWSEEEARKTAHRLWPNELLPGELSKELPTPRHFEQASSMVTDALPCGPDPEKHLAAIRQYIEAGFDEVCVQRIGPQQEDFFRFFEKELRPKL